MADKKIWNEDITPETDWGGDESTGYLPVSGEKVQKFIKSQLASLQEQISGIKPIVVVSPEEWKEMKKKGLVLPGVLYGITESEEPPQPESQDIVIDEEAGTMTVTDARYDSLEETLEMVGELEEGTETLILYTKSNN